ncbi:MAG: T9SS type A sorting domain-containing protein [Ignavibacteriales bacterium]|nr:MAG: T9SS type A sorting domain-containing protein [Ignavibacteriales bacterium]
MKISHCFMLFIIFVAVQINVAQQINKVIVSGYGGQHDLDVKNAFHLGYSSYNNSQFTGEVLLYSGTLQTSFNYAALNDYDLIIRSTTGLVTGLQLAPYYPDIKLVMPSGSNSFVQTFSGDVVNSPVVVTGAGVTSNVTGYKLEFFSIDPITTDNQSSYSNGYIAGQLTFIANMLHCSFDSARIVARESSSQNGVFSTYNGFGKILTENIFTGELPVELVSFTAKVYDNKIILDWKTNTETNNYGFEIERTISAGTGAGWQSIGFVDGNGNSNSPHYYSFVDIDYPKSDKLIYRLKQIDTDGKYEYSNEIEVDISAISIDYALYQNYPNPFNPSTKISFNLAKEEFVNINIYSVLGGKITTLTNQFFEAGKHEIDFNADAFSSGIYLYKIEVGVNGEKFSQIKKMNLIK